MKRIFALVLALLMLVTLASCAKKDGEDEKTALTGAQSADRYVFKTENEFDDKYTFEYIGEDEVAITAFTGSEVLHAITLPEKIENRAVTVIGESAFNGASNISSVTLPATVKVIEDTAFAGCEGLVSINYPEGMTTIGAAAFANCTYLATAELPATVTEIGMGAFANCKSLVTLSLAGVAEIPNSICQGCVSLTTVTWGEVGTKVGDYAFIGCTELVSVNFPATVTEIGDYAFSGCAKLETLGLLGADVVIGENAIFGTPVTK